MRESRTGRYYPPSGQGGRRTLAGDITVVVLIVLFAWMGFEVHGSIAGLADTTRGVERAGVAISDTGQDVAGEVRGGLGAAADAVGSAPFIGGTLADRLREAGDRSAEAIETQAQVNGERLQEAGRQGTDEILDLAQLVGWLAFLVPTILVLSQALPTRLRRFRELRA